MKNILYITFLGIMLLISKSPAYATHTVGGDISYRCIGNNNFEFTFTLYHDCRTGAVEAIGADNPSYFSIFERNTNALVVDTTTVYGAASTGPAITWETVFNDFSSACILRYPDICLSRMVFKFVVHLPPSDNGYLFVYQRCCRNANVINILNSGGSGVTFTSIIPPFKENECPNNSPVFNAKPPQVICANDPLNVDFSATDMDGDSLSYELCSAYLGGSVSSTMPGNPNEFFGSIATPPYSPVSYNPPFNANYPIASSPVLTINPVTGRLTGKPIQPGRYILTVCVREWRNGTVISSLNRDLQFLVADCSRTVVADLPELSGEPGTYVIQCSDSRTIEFRNDSRGGITYSWDFGVPGITSDTSNVQFPTYTYPDTGSYVVKLVLNRGTTCADSISKIVRVYPPHVADFKFEGKLCEGSPIQFTDLSETALPPFTGWHWDFGDGNTSDLQNPVHIFKSDREEYDVQLISKSQRGCMDSIIRKVTIPFFVPSAGNDTLIVQGHPFHMDGSGGMQYQWSPGTYLNNTTDPKTTTSFPGPGVYRYNLNVTSAQNCVADDSVSITVLDKPWFVVPTAFTPNGDGRNDVIKPLSVGYIRLVYFKIYNRWGQLVFQTYSFNSGGWDGTFKGKPAEIGVYHWQAAAVDPFNETLEQKGDFTLFR